MASFIYKARNVQGESIHGIIDAADENKAASAIEHLGLIPIQISHNTGSYSGSFMQFRIKRISRQELLIFTRQLSTLIATGAPLITSIQNVADQAQNPRFKQILGSIVSSLESGVSFSESLAQYPDIFGDLYVSLIKVGEAGGLLDKVLARLAELSVQEIDLRSRITSALVYPAVLASVAFIIVNFVLVAVLPKFTAIFEASSAKLPLPTRALLGLSYLARNYWWLMALAAVFILNALRNYYRTPDGRRYFDSLFLRLPLFGPLTLKVMVSRLSRSIAALTKSGVPVLEALTVVETTVSNVVLQNMIKDTRAAISSGQSLTEPFKASGLFPPMVIQLINTGERTGRLDKMFDQIADFYEPEIEFTIRNLTSLLEPIMLLVMGTVVVFIALSVLLPIFNLISVIKK
ncbi:MAG: type II secretion system F family protein [Candidatus Omnitrophica bacterium]|jgi:type IV pilus assembly protein PilC|nr:type II secretion system F family protein [Candidatus Omnitrophota bacterium]